MFVGIFRRFPIEKKLTKLLTSIFDKSSSCGNVFDGITIDAAAGIVDELFRTPVPCEYACCEYFWLAGRIADFVIPFDCVKFRRTDVPSFV